MKQITTKYGDKGFTKLHGEPFIKSHEIFETVGVLDEVMAALSVAALETDNSSHKAILYDIIREIYEISAIVTGYDINLTRTFYNIQKFEGIIESVPPLTGFTIGYHTKASAALNIVRTITRRAERQLVRSLVMKESISEVDKTKILEYFNRLSDLLFSLAELNK